MRNGDAEIEFLERLYGLEVKTMNQDWELNQLVTYAVSDMTRCAGRAGRDDLAGLACYFCGRSVSETKLSRCECSFPEAFRCGIRGRRICADCEGAHKEVASHLELLFSLPFVNRVNSRRLRAWRELSRAIRACYDESAEPHDCPLYSEIAQVDEWDTETFRRDLLKCFAIAKFLDFQSLAKNLKQEADESLIRSIVRSGLLR